LADNTKLIVAHGGHDDKFGPMNSPAGISFRNNPFKWKNYTAWTYPFFSDTVRDFLCLAKDPIDATLYAGTYYNGMWSFKSDGTATVNTGIENRYIIDNITPYDISSSANIYTKDVNPFENCLLQLNGQDRFSVRKGNYFNLVQPYQHHTNIPLNRGINVYSFALKPEEHQPSGTLNMSRIDTATLAVNPRTANGTAVSGSIYIYAVNYNVLRILSGMGGLAYSN
jgi:hypothetical protein